jgi:hypothetical protein
MKWKLSESDLTRQTIEISQSSNPEAYYIEETYCIVYNQAFLDYVNGQTNPELNSEALLTSDITVFEPVASVYSNAERYLYENIKRRGIELKLI